MSKTNSEDRKERARPGRMAWENGSLPSQVGFTFLLGLLYLPAFAQQVPPSIRQSSPGIDIEPRLPVVGFPTPPGAQTPEAVSATIARARADLQHEDEEIRLGATMLLGKYNQPEAIRLLNQALRDASTPVRRAAVVSLLERRRITDPETGRALLRRLGDPDPEIRRHVSFALGLLGSGLRVTQPSLGGGNRSVIRIPPDLERVLLDAFSDEEPIVRINMLRNHSALGLAVSHDLIIDRLADENREVVISAIAMTRRIPVSERLLDEMERLAGTNDDGIRFEVVTALKRNRDSRVATLLRAMVDDPDPLVRTEAILSLAAFDGSIESDTLHEILKWISEQENPTRQIMRVVDDLRRIGPQAKEAYAGLTRHPNSRVRLIAWRSYLSYDEGWENPEIWLRVSTDESSEVRSHIIRNVISMRKQVGPAHIAELAESRHEDVRQLAVKFLQRIDHAQGSELVIRFLIDDSLEVRLEALKMMTSRQFEQWDSFLGRSLYDDEVKVQKIAVDLLMARPKLGQLILQSFVTENDQAPLTYYIRQKLGSIRKM